MGSAGSKGEQAEGAAAPQRGIGPSLPDTVRFINLVLRRPLPNSGEFWSWYHGVMGGTVDRRSGTVVLRDGAGGEVTRFRFHEAWPCRWNASLSHAPRGDVLLEEIEVAVERMERA